jgi:hypothetical protein
VSIFDQKLSMRKLLAISGLCLLLAHSLPAQKGWKAGFTVSPLNSWMLNQSDLDTVESVFKYQSTWGMQGGLVGGYNLSQRLGVWTNILYGVQGQRYTTMPNGLNREVKNNTSLYYIKVPLLIRFSTKPVRKFLWSIYAGPQVSFLTKAKFFNDDYRFLPDNPSVKYPDTRDLYNEFHYSMVGGIGSDIRLTRELYLNLNVRVEYSLNDTEKKSAQYYEKELNRLIVKNYYPNKRPITRTFVYGLNVGFTYHFLKR